MEVTFEHLSGSKKGQVEQINAERITVGRNPDNLLSFDPHQDLDVSGSHATLSDADGGRLMLTDLGSRNGTLLNGKPIAGATLVESGSKIKFGANGPEVKIAFTSGPKKPGATRVMLANVQQQMETERAQAAASKKKLTLILGVVVLIGLLGGGGFVMYSSSQAKKKSAAQAKAASSELADKANAKQTKLYAMAKYKEAEATQTEADALFAKGDWVKAEEKYGEARKQFDKAIDEADAVQLVKMREESIKKLRELQAAADASNARAQEQLEEANRRALEQDAANKKRMEDIQKQMAAANAAERAKMQAELDKLNKQPNSETARKIIQDNEGSIVVLTVESFYQAKDSKNRTPIARFEGCGFAIDAEHIATAKHVLQPWKFDPKLVAQAKKLKEEHGFDIQDYVKVTLKTAKGWEDKYDSAAGTAKILKIMPDKWDPKTQAVEIDWNQQTTAVAGVQVHLRNIDDLAIIHVPGAKLKAVQFSDDAAKKFDNEIVLGTVRAPENKVISVSPARAEVQTEKDDVFSINATVPARFGGGPVFSYDGKVRGIVLQPDAQNLMCHPVSMIKKLLGGGGGTTIKAGQNPGAGAPGGAAPEDEDE